MKKLSIILPPEEMRVHIVNHYYAEQMKRRGVKLDNLKVVKHFFTPTGRDLEKLVKIIQDCETVVDIGSGYGLLLNELAKKTSEQEYLGIDTMYWDKKFPMPKPEKNVEFEFNGIEAMTSKVWNRRKRMFDCVICCWMPHGSDWREMLTIICKKKIILILSQDFATGTIETYTGLKEFGFELDRVWRSGKSIIQVWIKN